jgi:hypothetical protein
MNFYEALDLTKEGKKVHRSSWTDKEKYYDNFNFKHGLFTFEDIEAKDWDEYIIEIKHNDNNVIQTIGQLKEFLNSFDDNALLDCEYINIQFGKYLGIKHRPLLKSLFEKTIEGNILFKAMFY